MPRTIKRCANPYMHSTAFRSNRPKAAADWLLQRQNKTQKQTGILQKVARPTLVWRNAKVSEACMASHLLSWSRPHFLHHKTSVAGRTALRDNGGAFPSHQRFPSLSQLLQRTGEEFVSLIKVWRCQVAQLLFPRPLRVQSQRETSPAMCL